MLTAARLRLWWQRMTRQEASQWACACGDISVTVSGPPISTQRLADISAIIEHNLARLGPCRRCGAVASFQPR